jgi:hypothetical protein
MSLSGKNGRVIQKIAAWVLCFALALTPAGDTIRVEAAGNNAASSTGTVREYSPRLEELVCGVSLGFTGDVDDQSPVTYAQYYAMLEHLVELLYPGDTERLTKWQNKYPGARISGENISRQNAIYMMYRLANDILGAPYSELTDYLGYTPAANRHLAGNLRYETYEMDYTKFPDADEDCKFYLEGSGTYTWPAHLCSRSFVLEKQAVNGYSLFEVDDDTQDLRGDDTLNLQEAVWSCVRMYNSVDRYDMDQTASGNKLLISDAANADLIYKYNTDIITPELLSNASDMTALEPTLESIPAYNGLAVDWNARYEDYPSNQLLSEARFRTMSDLGFDCARVMINCTNLFDVGVGYHDGTGDAIAKKWRTYDSGQGYLFTAEEEDFTTVNLACLTRLDQVVSYGLKYGVHINLQFFNYPGHYQYYSDDGRQYNEYDFCTNAEKQQIFAKMWQILAKRYADIPSSVLSFTLVYEGMTSTYDTVETMQSGLKVLYDAVRAEDPDRFLYSENVDPDAKPNGTLIKELMDIDNDGKAELGQQYLGKDGYYSYWHLLTLDNSATDDPDVEASADVSSAEGYNAVFPTYEAPKYYQAANADFTVSGFLPAGTKIEFTGTAGGPSSLEAKMVSPEGAVLFDQSYAADSSNAGKISVNLSLTLDKTISSAELTLTGLGETDTFALEKFMITLPEEYAVSKMYSPGYKNVANNSDADVYARRVTTSEIEIKVYSDTASAITSASAALSETGLAETLHLDDFPGLAVTVNQDCSYTTNYGLTEQGIENYVAYVKEKLKEYGGVGLFCELFTHGNSSDPYFIRTWTKAAANAGMGWMYYCPERIYSGTATEELDVSQAYDNSYRWVGGTAVNAALYDAFASSMTDKCTLSLTVPNATANPIQTPDYAGWAAVYSDEACTSLTENLGYFTDIDAIFATASKKNGYLKLMLQPDAAVTAIPDRGSLAGIFVDTTSGEWTTQSTLTLASDVTLLCSLKIPEQGISVTGNKHTIRLSSGTISGGALRASNLSLVILGNETTEIQSDIAGLDHLYMGQVEDGYTLDVSNVGEALDHLKYQPNLIVSGKLSGIGTLHMYGNSLYLSENGELSVGSVAGIYGNIYLQKKSDGTLSKLTVSDSMSQMGWQLRLYAYEKLNRENLAATVTVKVSQGTVLAYIPATADKSVLEKLGIMFTGNDDWATYEKKLLQDNCLYYDDGSAEIKHLASDAWSSDGTKHWHVCTVCEAKTGEAAHSLKTATVTKATTSKNGEKETRCLVCGKVTQTTTIYAAKKISLSATVYTYDGKTKKPSVTVKDSKGNKIASSNYTVTYKNNKKVGKATVTITFKGDYTGTITKTFAINPKATSLKTAVSKKTKTIAVTWKKQATQTTGYEVQYSTSSKFTKKTTKTVTVKSAKTTSTTIRKLKAKKKYYIRIRTYKTVGGKKYYSGWSKAKSLTTK